MHDGLSCRVFTLVVSLLSHPNNSIPSPATSWYPVRLTLPLRCHLAFPVILEPHPDLSALFRSAVSLVLPLLAPSKKLRISFHIL